MAKTNPREQPPSVVSQNECADIGIVAIGRNEGSRLEACLRSVVAPSVTVVYVDSGSTDGSVQRAMALGAEVVELDLSIPFTAARARNAGFARLMAIAPNTTYVQFVDGDCEVVKGWLSQAYSYLVSHPEFAIVCGRRRERSPHASLYNRLCDLEWNTPVGEAQACGGDFMIRTEAFQSVNGFTSGLIAGEEPELCVRLRQQSWKIARIDADMTLHDAQMTRFGQWWKRMVRAGHAYAEGSWLHGRSPERHWVKESKSIWLWGLIVPTLILTLIPLTQGWSLVLVLVYPLLVAKVYYSLQRQGQRSADAALYAYFCIVGKFPGVVGQLKFHRNRLLSQQSTLIEYKS